MFCSALATGRRRDSAETGPNARRLRSISASRSSSGPSGRISMPLRTSPELLHDVVGHRVVGVDILDVVGVLKRLDEPEHFPGVVLVKLDLDGRQEWPLLRLVVKSGILDRGPHRHQLARLALHLA